MSNVVFLKSLVIVLILGILFHSCETGCTDSDALNKNYNAYKDDGSCLYSKIVFYASAGFFNGIPIIGVDVTVNGNSLGNTSGAYYPSGPGNCSAPGTVSFQFEDGNTVDWNASVLLLNGSVLITSGTASPSSIQECIKVNLTR